MQNKDSIYEVPLVYLYLAFLKVITYLEIFVLTIYIIFLDFVISFLFNLIKKLIYCLKVLKILTAYAFLTLFHNNQKNCDESI